MIEPNIYLQISSNSHKSLKETKRWIFNIFVWVIMWRISSWWHSLYQFSSTCKVLECVSFKIFKEEQHVFSQGGA